MRQGTAGIIDLCFTVSGPQLEAWKAWGLTSSDCMFILMSGAHAQEAGCWQVAGGRGAKDLRQNSHTWSLNVAWASSQNGGWIQRTSTSRGRGTERDRERTRWTLRLSTVWSKSPMVSLLLCAVSQSSHRHHPDTSCWGRRCFLWWEERQSHRRKST